jgi:hypothetical protein
LLVRIAGESLASSAPESVSERCEQCALGLQKFTSNRQLARQYEIELLGELNKRPGKSRQIITNFRRIGAFLGSDEYLSCPGKFEILEEYLSFTGPHIKKLIISD